MNWAVFVSGRGSNLSALLETGQVQVVVSSKADCPAVGRARRRGLPILIQDKNADYNSLTEKLQSMGVTNILLAGFMRILPAEFVEAWDNRMYNIHPSLLPSYPGLRSIQRAFEDGAEMGATLHLVDQGVDSGQVIWQKPIVSAQNLEAATQNTHRVEHQLVRRLVQ